MEFFLPSRGVMSIFQNDAGFPIPGTSLFYTLCLPRGRGGEVLIRSTQDALDDLLTHAQTKH
jgi:hypothetical protein